MTSGGHKKKPNSFYNQTTTMKVSKSNTGVTLRTVYIKQVIFPDVMPFFGCISNTCIFTIYFYLEKKKILYVFIFWKESRYSFLLFFRIFYYYATRYALSEDF